jgi:hypothetical protein
MTALARLTLEGQCWGTILPSCRVFSQFPLMLDVTVNIKELLFFTDACVSLFSRLGKHNSGLRNLICPSSNFFVYI